MTNALIFTILRDIVLIKSKRVSHSSNRIRNLHAQFLLENKKIQFDNCAWYVNFIIRKIFSPHGECVADYGFTTAKITISLNDKQVKYVKAFILGASIRHLIQAYNEDKE